MRNRTPEHHVSRRMHGRSRAATVGLIALALAGCSPGGGATPEPTILPGASGGGSLSAAQLRLHLIDALGPRWYCDSDEYPVSHGSEQERAIERWAEVEADQALLRAIGDRLGIDLSGRLGDADKLVIYRQWKVAASIPFEALDATGYRFDYLAQPVAGAHRGLHTAGTIDDRGTITVGQQVLEGEPNCPICLSRGTLIDTPAGTIPVERVRLGDPIWTLDRSGRRIAGTVIALGSTPAPANHRVVHLRLADGRALIASPGHPLADGRLLGDIRVGDTVAGSRVVAADLATYGGGETFDIVASGPTGRYLAGGIPLGSTLR